MWSSSIGGDSDSLRSNGSAADAAFVAQSVAPSGGGERQEVYFIGLSDVLTSTLMARWSKTPKGGGDSGGATDADSSKAQLYARRLVDNFRRYVQ